MLCLVPPGSAISRCAWFRQAGSCYVLLCCHQQGYCSGLAFNLRFFCRVSACEVGILPTAPLVNYCAPPRFNQVSARIVPSSWQTSAQLATIKEALFTNAQHCPSQLVEKSPIRGLHLFTLKLPAFIDFCIGHICR